MRNPSSTFKARATCETAVAVQDVAGARGIHRKSFTRLTSPAAVTCRNGLPPWPEWPPTALHYIERAARLGTLLDPDLVGNDCGEAVTILAER
jgi:hypothetical protein